MRDRKSLLAVAIGVLLAASAVQVVRLSWLKAYSLDEFQYSHAAWLVAKGRVPYRDFFEFHFPLPYQALALPYLFLDSNPENIRVLRIAMLAVLALAFAALYRVNRREAPWVALAGPLLAASAPLFISLATEIRPDPFAFALFLASITVLLPLPGSAPRPFASGALFALAVWGSQKALLYGAVYPAALALDLLLNRRRGDRRLLGSPARWLAGALAVAAAVGLYLAATGSAGAWFSQCLVWAAGHERDYPGFPWTRYFLPALREHLPLFLLAALGLLRTLRRLFADRDAPADPELLLVGALGTTLGSFLFARAPFPYALVPFLGMLCAFAARGLATLAGAVALLPGAPWGRGAAAAGLALLLLWAVPLRGLLATGEKLQHDNRYQHEVLAALHRLTAETDPVYDNSGGFTARPHVGFRFYTSALIHKREAADLATRIPREIQADGCTAFLHDLRFDYLPEPAQRFVREHFQPYNADLWLWGQRFPSGEARGDFDAVRTARYFVEPASLLDAGTLLVDGQPVQGPELELSRGRHAVEYCGPPREFFLLWLPRNGERYRPVLGLTPRFSTLF